MFAAESEQIRFGPSMAMAMSAIFIILAYSLGLASGVPTTSTGLTYTSLIWGNCGVFNVTNASPNLSCGYYQVPMDYFNPDADTARLAVIKYQATVPNKKGTLFVNPGGPGGSGIGFMTSYGDQISSEIQGQYDIVSWDPRGVGSYTFPGGVTCFSTLAEQLEFWDNTVVKSINETISTNFTDPDELEEFFSRVPETDAKLEEFGERCLASKSGPYLQYIGTTSTIRDLVSLADEIVGPGQPIDYYGYSYGTIIGFYFLSMFPDRVGHVILDGVVNPIKWGSYDLNYVTLVDSEEAFTAFADACAQAGAAKCSLVRMIKNKATGSDVSKLITSTIDLALKLQRVGYTELPAQAGKLKAELFLVPYLPARWQRLANHQIYTTIVAILTAGRAHGFTDPYILPKDPVGPPPDFHSTLSYSAQAIAGADGALSNGIPLRKVFEVIVATTRDRTPIFGARWSIMATAPKWPVRSVETLPTFKRRTLSNRVLVIGNTIDLITPFKNAEYITRLLGSKNAVLVEHQVVGHTTLAQYSNCTHDIVLDYLLNSQLPLQQQHTKCAPNPNDFFPDTFTDAHLVLPEASIKSHLQP